MTTNNIIAKKSKNGYFTSIVFLWLVIVTTIGLHFYNNFILSEINNIKDNIVSIESNIEEVEKDKNLQVYSLLELNKTILESYKKMNRVTLYLNHMNTIAAKYNLEFSWFNLANWEINTNIKIDSDNKWIAYQKTRDFIKQYRNDKMALFDLSFVNGVEWMDSMKFKANFIINNLDK